MLLNFLKSSEKCIDLNNFEQQKRIIFYFGMKKTCDFEFRWTCWVWTDGKQKADP